MRIIRWPSAPSRETRGAVVAIGNFDGVHAGHRAVVAAAARRAEALGAPLGVVTFEPHPREVMQPDGAPARLTSLARKAEIFRGLGVHLLHVLRFDAALMRRPAEAFVDEILEGDLGVRAVAAGRDFRFGNRRRGDVAMLEAAAHVPVDIVEPLRLDGTICSSTRIRELLQEGEVEAAAGLLRYPYELEGTVVPGDRRGRTIGFPTANVRPKGRRPQLPGIGVYAVRAGVRARGDDALVAGGGQSRPAADRGRPHAAARGASARGRDRSLRPAPAGRLLGAPARRAQVRWARRPEGADRRRLRRCLDGAPPWHCRSPAGLSR